MNYNIIKPAQRTENISYAVRDIVVVAEQVAKTGKKILYLNIGDPNLYDFAPPREIVEATYNAMLKNNNGYAPSAGIMPAIESIERDVQKKGITNIQEIFVSTGASEAIDICLTALINNGENVLTPTPGYPLYTAISSKLQLIRNPYYLLEENNWMPDIEDIKSRINKKTKGIILINPNNPTGKVYSKELLLQIIDVALENNLVIFADEIYDKLIYDEKQLVSIASLNPDAPVVTFGGLSKNFMVPGFRIGWGVISGNKNLLAPYVEAVNKLLRARLSANHPEQYAIPAALDGNQESVKEAMQKLTKRRNLTVDMLNSIPGITCSKPEGSFYCFPKVEINNSDNHFVTELLKETGVLVVPGTGFGQREGTRHFRIVFLPPEDVLEEAYRKISEFLEIYKDKYDLAVKL
ncbi:MAG: aminotransferase class I/II-fold pyridoxal phosphate-dependent enzyme [Ignavibacteria bacterium]|nr:aminotransferase class I/II-fold pyridoxal phosphate-dependent enzyme [Ignavibacteria bacterium]